MFGIFRTISHNLLHYHVPDNDNIKVGSICPTTKNTYPSKSIICIIILIQSQKNRKEKKSSDKIP